MNPQVSVVIAAYQEAERIGATVRALRGALESLTGVGWELLVIDDGSTDGTATEAAAAGARVLSLPANAGKGSALTTGFRESAGSVLLMLDADLADTAAAALPILNPVLAGNAEMAVGVLMPPPDKAGSARPGFGLVMRLARWGVRRAGGTLRAPLSGQRALARSAWERIGRLDARFGVEMGLDLDALRLGLRIVEVPVPLTHRLTGRDWAGFRHRGRQFRDVLLAILRRWPLRKTG